MRKYVFEPLHLNFQSRSNLCSGFSFFFSSNIPILLRSPREFTFTRHIINHEISLREKIRISRRNINPSKSRTILKNRSPLFFLSHSNKNSREKKGEHTRLTETVEFGYRAFRRRSLLNKFLPSLPRIPARARCFDNEKPRLFGANHALNTSFLPSPSFCPRNCIPVASFIARIFPFRLPPPLFRPRDPL